MIEVEVKGLKEIEEKLKKFPILLQRDIIDKGLRAGGAVIRTEARRNIHNVSGTLARNIRMRKKRATSVSNIFHLGSFDRTPGWYGRLVEEGTKPHLIPTEKRRRKMLSINGKIYRKVSHPGARPKPWLIPAFESSRDAVINKFKETCNKWIDKYMKW